MGLRRGFFITFEGTEGSGKSTQIRRAAAYLRRKGRCVLVLREPGGTRTGERIRGILLNRKLHEMVPETELLLYLAARAQLVRERIEPALRKGMTVISDRFEDSTAAYQGFGRGIPLAAIRMISRILVRGKLEPDLTFVLDIDPVRGMKRGGRCDRIEREPDRFHQRVRRGFLALARKNPRRLRVLDASESKEKVWEKMREALRHAV